MRRSKPVAALAVLVAGAVVASVAQASVLCRTKHKALVVRDVCKPKEETLGVPRLDELGFRGARGPAGAPGPAMGNLRVLDATGQDVGVVLETGSYYGQYVRVAREMTLPGGSGPEFVAFTLRDGGLASYGYGCSDADTFHRAADCTGPAFQRCEYGCSSAEGAFFFLPLERTDEGSACFVRGGREFERGDFHHRVLSRGFEPGEAAARCADRGGTVLGPEAPCRGGFCLPCCAPERHVGVAPIHTFDAAALGTPPFRLAR